MQFNTQQNWSSVSQRIWKYQESITRSSCPDQFVQTEGFTTVIRKRLNGHKNGGDHLSRFNDFQLALAYCSSQLQFGDATRTKFCMDVHHQQEVL
ncbi:MAG: hypothetical protein KME06_07025 [Kastovskya adunca ATA6-11-RM4]|nr:hypothetical protein [Kastovskya adunca ATA6-11-RM4]